MQNVLWLYIGLAKVASMVASSHVMVIWHICTLPSWNFLGALSMVCLGQSVVWTCMVICIYRLRCIGNFQLE